MQIFHFEPHFKKEKKKERKKERKKGLLKEKKSFANLFLYKTNKDFDLKNCEKIEIFNEEY